MTRGFTLVEVVVVLVLLGVMAAVAAPAFLNEARGNDLRDGAAVVQRILDRARVTARVSGHRVTVTLDATNSRYWIDDPALTGAIALPAGATLWSERPRARVTFQPAGPASADPIAVQAHGVSAALRVDRFTGEVTTDAR
jgi:prepilin-type N-terminal cleavage/methylation domain-containing protein